VRREYPICAISESGVHVTHEEMVAYLKDATSIVFKTHPRGTDLYPFEVSFMHDNVEFFALFSFAEVYELKAGWLVPPSLIAEYLQFVEVQNASAEVDHA
jgi:hypothetical protein